MYFPFKNNCGEDKNGSQNAPAISLEKLPAHWLLVFFFTVDLNGKLCPYYLLLLITILNIFYFFLSNKLFSSIICISNCVKFWLTYKVSIYSNHFGFVCIWSKSRRHREQLVFSQFLSIASHCLWPINSEYLVEGRFQINSFNYSSPYDQQISIFFLQWNLSVSF